MPSGLPGLSSAAAFPFSLNVTSLICDPVRPRGDRSPSLLFKNSIQHWQVLITQFGLWLRPACITGSGRTRARNSRDERALKRHSVSACHAGSWREMAQRIVFIWLLSHTAVIDFSAGTELHTQAAEPTPGRMRYPGVMNKGSAGARPGYLLPVLPK